MDGILATWIKLYTQHTHKIHYNTTRCSQPPVGEALTNYLYVHVSQSMKGRSHDQSTSWRLDYSKSKTNLKEAKLKE